MKVPASRVLVAYSMIPKCITNKKLSNKTASTF